MRYPSEILYILVVIPEHRAVNVEFTAKLKWLKRLFGAHSSLSKKNMTPEMHWHIIIQ